MKQLSDIRYPDIVYLISSLSSLSLSLLSLSLSPQSPAPKQPPDGARIYAATCQACHQSSGLGLPNQFPPLVGSEWVLGNDDRFIMIILHGVVGEIEVEGETFNGAMPTWGPTFKDEELAAVASYVRRSWGNKGAPITTATVTRVRLAHATRTKPWTAAELQKATSR